MAAELAQDKISVNAICPASVETNLLSTMLKEEAQLLGTTPAQLRQELLKSIPLGRFARPDDVAKMAVFLSSNESDYVTGQAFNVDGGAQL